MTRVRILLDVDGVLNVVPFDPDKNVWDEWQVGHAERYQVAWSPQLVKRIKALSERDGVEILWLTTWEDKANEYLAPLLGLPEFKVAGRQIETARTNGGWWKFGVAHKLWNDDHIPFVWIDDELTNRYDGGSAEWVASLGGPGLAVAPSTSKGITPRLMDAVEKFVDIVLEEA